MIGEVCLYCKNWFDYERVFGKITIKDGVITTEKGEIIKDNQYYRIVGSIFNDGVYKHTGTEALINEDFSNGAVWLMAVPADFVSLVTEISLWQGKFGGVESENMSPYQSESFNGYSYSKGSSGSGISSVPTWQSVFADRLDRYRKL